MIKTTAFKGGGLQPELIECLGTQLSAPRDFSVPRYVDSRPYMLPSDNQGNFPACAGYAMAAWIEAHNWWNTNVAQQVDALALYRRAKELDGGVGEGTTFQSIIQSAKDLRFVPEASKARFLRTASDVKFAMHKHRICLGGFDITTEWNEVDSETGFIANKRGSSLGGHAVLICWYDEVSVGFQNSWSMDWGDKGFGRMTWEQFEKQFLYGAVVE